MIYLKKIMVTACLSATVVFAATASMHKEKGPDNPQWKNLKVLPKDISEKDLHKVMEDWNNSLGVRCGFCHARNTETNRNDFPSDAKPEKNAAREMMKMTEKINKEYFKDEKAEKDMLAAVSCYTCHHGSAHPETTAPARERGPGQGGPGQGPGGAGQGQTPPPTGTTPPPPQSK